MTKTPHYVTRYFAIQYGNSGREYAGSIPALELSANEMFAEGYILTNLTLLNPNMTIATFEHKTGKDCQCCDQRMEF